MDRHVAVLVVAGDEGGRLMVAEDDRQRRAPAAALRTARGESAHDAERVFEREAILLAHPVAVAPDHVRRVAGGGEGIEDAAVAERVPGQERRDRRPGRVRRR